MYSAPGYVLAISLSILSLPKIEILDWGIINLNRDPICQCGLQKECSKIATYQVTDSNNGEVKYCCTTHVKKFNKKKKLNSNYDLFKISQILMEELNSKTDFLNHEIICIENQPALKNPVMKTVQMILYSYFMIEGVTKDIEIQKEILNDVKNRLARAEATWDMAENIFQQLADQVRQHEYDIKDLNR